MANDKKTNENFQMACMAAGVQPGNRQYSKYRRHFGLAYTTEHGLAVGSRVNERGGLEFSDQRASGGAAKTNDYGPYSATPNGKDWVRPVKY